MPTNMKKSVDRVKAEARSRWDKLTDEDFDSIKTNVVELATRLQARYGLMTARRRRSTMRRIGSIGWSRTMPGLPSAGRCCSAASSAI